MSDRLATTVEVEYPAEPGRIRLRGSGGRRSWGASLAPSRAEAGLHVFELPMEHGEIAELKPVRDERVFSNERNATVLAGETLRLSPYFDRENGRLESPVHRR